jgi:hypothetical protein
VPREIDDWRQHGEVLIHLLKTRKLKCYGTVAKLKKEVQTGLDALESSTVEKELIKNRDSLNELRFELGKYWSAWSAKINQLKIDAKRKRKNIVFTEKEEFTRLAINSGYAEVDSKFMAALQDAVEHLGIHRIGELYDIRSVIDKYMPEDILNKNTTLFDEEKESKTIETLRILQTFLSKKGADSFPELVSLTENKVKTRNDAERYHLLKNYLISQGVTESEVSSRKFKVHTTD